MSHQYSGTILRALWDEEIDKTDSGINKTETWLQKTREQARLGNTID